MSIQQILDQKGSRLVTIRPEDTIETTAVLLSSNNIGAVPVRDSDGAMIGVISERDLIHSFADKGAAIMSLTVRDLMTKKVISVRPGDSVKDAMEKMSKRHIRHLPVVDDEGALLGIISQRDVMQIRLQETALETDELRAYAIASGGSMLPRIGLAT